MISREYIERGLEEFFNEYATVICPWGHITERIHPTYRNFFTCVDDINRVVANRKRGK